MPQSARLSLVILAVHDVARMARFYEEAFGWPIAVDVPVYREYALPEGMRLGLYLREGFEKNTALPVSLRTAAYDGNGALSHRRRPRGDGLAALRARRPVHVAVGGATVG